MEILPPDSPGAGGPATPAPRPTERSPILYGPNGLRAGWSVVLYVVLLALFSVAARYELRWFATRLAPHPGSPANDFHPAFGIVAEVSTLLVVVLATAIMAFIEGRRVVDYGLAGVDRVRQFCLGLLSGFGFLSLLVGILVATHHLQLHLSPQPWRQTALYAAAWGLCFLLVGMTEELMLRGYLLYTLARGIRFWPAAILLAMLFGLLHKGNPGESPFGLIAAAMIALVFSLSLWRLGHLWWAIGFHVTWDWAESFFYGTPDSGIVSAGRLMHAQPVGNILLSGGVTGPEGSVWITLIVLLLALFVWKTQPYRGVQLTAPAHPVISSGDHPTEPEHLLG